MFRIIIVLRLRGDHIRLIGLWLSWFNFHENFGLTASRLTMNFLALTVIF